MVRVNIPSVLKSFSIYRVPQHIRDCVDKKYYEPKVVSIGPYHHKEPHLRAMEERKHLYLQNFLQASKPLTTREDYVGCIRALEHTARARYFESPVPELMSSDDFVEMLLLDGCFILQFFIEWFVSPHRDPIFKVDWMLPLLHNDLLMLENQIPYDVLLALYALYCRDPGRPTTPVPKKPLMAMIAEYFGKRQSLPMGRVDPSQEDRIDHLLHLFHCHFITPPTVEEAPDAPRPRRPPRPCPTSIPSARELDLHGVTFQLRLERSNILDVTFRGGIFQIPLLTIEEPDCSRYMNLVAFEMSHHEVHKHLTSYVVLMDYLIDTPEDVLILKDRGILKSQMSSAHEVADFFNQLRHCSYINYEKHYLRRVYLDVDDYCSNKGHRTMATLRRNYLSNPWAVVGFVFAVLFACFTIFSTVISIMQTFFHLPK